MHASMHMGTFYVRMKLFFETGFIFFRFYFVIFNAKKFLLPLKTLFLFCHVYFLTPSRFCYPAFESSAHHSKFIHELLVTSTVLQCHHLLVKDIERVLQHGQRFNCR